MSSYGKSIKFTIKKKKKKTGRRSSLTVLSFVRESLLLNKNVMLSLILLRK